jgi:hypothetical protein
MNCSIQFTQARLGLPICMLNLARYPSLSAGGRRGAFTSHIANILYCIRRRQFELEMARHIEVYFSQILEASAWSTSIARLVIHIS